MKGKLADVYFAFVSILFGALCFLYLIPYQIRSRAGVRSEVELFPKLAAMVIMIAGAGFLLVRIRSSKDLISIVRPRVDLQDKLVPILKQLLFIVSFIVSVLVMPTVGFVIPSIAFMLICLYMFGSRNLAKNIILSLVFPLLAYLLFSKLFRVSLPQGWLPL